MTDVFEKRSAAVPDGYFNWEAAGLRWLRAAEAARVVDVIEVGDHALILKRLEPASPSAKAARELGAGLAGVHNAGAAEYGVGPDGYSGPGFFGPLERPLSMTLEGHASYGRFYADRLDEMLAHCGTAGDELTDPINELGTRLRHGDFDATTDRPARVHGDLWSGNVMWTPQGAVLIDPAAHGGHREADLAMLHLFGCPHLDEVIAGYESVNPLAAKWRERIALHQVYPLLAHLALFGRGYLAQTLKAVRRSLRLD